MKKKINIKPSSIKLIYITKDHVWWQYLDFDIYLITIKYLTFVVI